MSELLRDLRFGVRLLAKSPVFTTTAAVLLAVGISANTLIFSMVNALLLRPLPVSHPENLVRLVEVHPTDFVTWDFPYIFCDRAASGGSDFSEVICQGEGDFGFDAAPNGGSIAERVRVHLVSPNFFSSLGVHPYLGRVLTAEDEHVRAQVAVLSYNFWRRRFRGDASVVGRKIILGGPPFTIVGVTPESFNGLAVDTSPDLRVPASVDRVLFNNGETNPPGPVFAQIFARLRNGVPFERANVEVDPLLYDELFRAFKRTGNNAIDSHLRLESIVNGVSTLRAQFSRGLEALMAGVALLLLMACANVAACCWRAPLPALRRWEFAWPWERVQEGLSASSSPKACCSRRSVALPASCSP